MTATRKAAKKRTRPWPKGCWRSGARSATRPPTISMAWLPESATEWNASASIEEAPVSRKPTNLATAMPRLASRAAITAPLACPLPPSAMGPAYPGRPLAWRIGPQWPAAPTRPWRGIVAVRCGVWTFGGIRAEGWRSAAGNAGAAFGPPVRRVRSPRPKGRGARAVDAGLDRGGVPAGAGTAGAGQSTFPGPAVMAGPGRRPDASRAGGLRDGGLQLRHLLQRLRRLARRG